MFLFADTKWKINVERKITAQPGSTVTIQCNFSYPKEISTNNVTVFWKTVTSDQSNCSNGDKDRNAFVFNPNNHCVLEKYRGKTKLIGDPNKGNCSLQITDITDIEQAIYVRIDVQKDKYSFIKDLVRVSFSINGQNLNQLFKIFNLNYAFIKKNEINSLHVSSTETRASKPGINFISALFIFKLNRAF